MKRNEIPLDLTGFHGDPLHAEIEAIEAKLRVLRWIEIQEFNAVIPPPIHDQRDRRQKRKRRLKIVSKEVA